MAGLFDDFGSGLFGGFDRSDLNDREINVRAMQAQAKADAKQQIADAKQESLISSPAVSPSQNLTAPLPAAGAPMPTMQQTLSQGFTATESDPTDANSALDTFGEVTDDIGSLVSQVAPIFTGKPNPVVSNQNPVNVSNGAVTFNQNTLVYLFIIGGAIWLITRKK